MSWTARLVMVAVAAATVIDVDWASAQAQVQVQPGGVNVRAGGVNVRAGDRGGYRLYGRRPWFGNANVRRQLKIDDNQYDSLNRTYVQYWTPYNQVVVGTPTDQTKIATAYGTFQNDFNTASAKVFVDPDVRNRYNQLNLQYQGYAAFNDPAVQARLKLNAEQQKNFQKYYTDWNQQMHQYADEYRTNRDAVNRQFTANWKQQRDRINETLTPDQRKSWNEMTGEAHDFDADAYFDEDARDDRRDARDDRRDNRDDRRDDRDDRRDPPRNPAPAPAPRGEAPRSPAPANPR